MRHSLLILTPCVFILINSTLPTKYSIQITPNPNVRINENLMPNRFVAFSWLACRSEKKIRLIGVFSCSYLPPSQNVVFSLHIITQFQSSHVPFFPTTQFWSANGSMLLPVFSVFPHRAQMLKIEMAVLCHDNMMYCF